MISSTFSVNNIVGNNKDEVILSRSNSSEKKTRGNDKKSKIGEISIIYEVFEKSNKILNEIDSLQASLLTPSYRDNSKDRQTPFLSTAFITPISSKQNSPKNGRNSGGIWSQESPSKFESPIKSNRSSFSCITQESEELLDLTSSFQPEREITSEGMAIHQCKKPFHEHFPLNMICTHQLCKNKKLICANCAIEDHKNHIKHCVQLTDFIAFFQNQMPNVKQSNINYELIRENIKVNYERSIEIVRFINNIFEDLLNTIKNDYSNILQKLSYLESCNTVYFNKILEEMEIKSHVSLDEVNQIIKVLTKYVQSERNGKIRNLKWLVNPNDTSILFDSFTKFQHEYLDKLEKTFQYVSLASNDILPKVSLIPKLTQSPCRFNKIYKNWGSANGFAQAISFESLEDNLILHGFGHYQPCKLPESGIIHYEYALIEGQKLDGKILYEDEGDIEKGKTIYENNMCNIFFKQNIPLQKRQIYTIRWINRTPDFDSYFGMGEITNTYPFKFMDTDINDYKKDMIKKFDIGATNLHQGFIPYLVYYK